jgi:hypothetical protein
MNNTVKIMINQTAFFGMCPPREAVSSPGVNAGKPYNDFRQL